MTIGIIGAGYIGKMLAEKFIQAGYQINISNSRGPESLKTLIDELGSNAKAVTTEEAATTDVVMLAVAWKDVESALTPIKERLVGKVLIDATNPFEGDKLVNLLEASASEIVASFIPGAHVVKAYNSLFGKYIQADPNVNDGKRVAFIAGDDSEAKKVVRQIVVKTGFSPVDIGDLKTGGALLQAGKPLAGLNLVKFQ